MGHPLAQRDLDVLKIEGHTAYLCAILTSVCPWSSCMSVMHARLVCLTLHGGRIVTAETPSIRKRKQMMVIFFSGSRQGRAKTPRNPFLPSFDVLFPSSYLDPFPFTHPDLLRDHLISCSIHLVSPASVLSLNILIVCNNIPTIPRATHQSGTAQTTIHLDAFKVQPPEAYCFLFPPPPSLDSSLSSLARHHLFRSLCTLIAYYRRSNTRSSTSPFTGDRSLCGVLLGATHRHRRQSTFHIVLAIHRPALVSRPWTQESTCHLYHTIQVTQHQPPYS